MANTWITDDNGNRCSVERWGNEEAARKALATLSDCSRCSDCSDCSRCSGCSDCSRCSDCSGCSYCSRCSDCSDCSGCSGCSGCSRCSDCSDFAPAKLDTPVPVIDDIHRRVYEAASRPGALNMDTWHTCETTHCRAGWVVHLAGAGGYELQDRTSCLFSAMQIYKASGYKISPVRFFDSDAEALADMRRLAEQAT